MTYITDLIKKYLFFTLTVSTLALALPLTGCGNTPAINTADSAVLEKEGVILQDAGGADHELNDKIWDVRQRLYISKEQLLKNLALSDYILLGETHDNLTHHLRQAWIID